MNSDLQSAPQPDGTLDGTQDEALEGMLAGLLPSEQYRVEKVQVLNWGGYHGLHVMPVGRRGTAILGPTGMGKSTVLDAMSAVMMPNPQEFNRAARDDGGKKAERTVFSYARGKTDEVMDSGSKGTTAHYLRTLGQAFPSGAAITWSTELGRRLTVARLAWIGPDTASQDEVTSGTVYALVHGAFDLARLTELRPARGARSPLTEQSLRELVNPARDLVTTSQPSMRVRMCHELGLGGDDESQLKALTLLRRAQASRGIFSINDLFKQFVLTEPRALGRWETTLTAYREASALYEVFELARKKLDVLDSVPAQAQKYREARDGATARRRALQADGEHAGVLQLWHAGEVEAWAERQVQANREQHRREQHGEQEARTRAAAAASEWEDAAVQLRTLGGDRSSLLTEKLERARETQQRLATDRRVAERDAQLAGVDAPTGGADVEDFRTQLHRRRAEVSAAASGAELAQQERSAQLVALRKQLRDDQADLESYRRRRSNVPPEADARRQRIADAVGIPAAQLPYVGELLEVDPAQRGWSVAVDRVLGDVATHLVVDAVDFARVRQFVDQNDMRGKVVLARARAGAAATRTPLPDTVPALVRLAPDSVYRGWLLDELVEDRSVLCVESADELDRPVPAGAKGAVTRQGLHTASRDRVVKDDRRARPSWIGLDNSARTAELDKQITSTTTQVDALATTYDQAQHEATERQRLLDTLDRLERTSWPELDLRPGAERIAALEEEIAAYAHAEPEIAQLRRQMEQHATDQAKQNAAAEGARERARVLDDAWQELVDVADAATRVLDSRPPLTEEERVSVSRLTFEEPRGPGDVGRSLTTAFAVLTEQARADERTVEQQEDLLEMTFRRYKDIDPSAEIDSTIASLPAVLEIHRVLREDDLPRAKGNWLAKAGSSMSDSLRALLTQIHDDAQVIRRGIRPINEALQGIEFRDTSSLQIDTREMPNSDLRDFRKTLTKHTTDTLGRTEPNPEQVERAFLALRRDLSRLEEKTRGGDVWRRRVLDAREHVQFRAVETRQDGTQIVHEGVAGKSGGEGQELIAFVLGAALRYRLGEGADDRPAYATIVLDEGFVKADTEYTGRALSALRGLGFQLIIGAPRDKVTAFEEHVDTVAYINKDPKRVGGVRIYPLSIREAVDLERLGGPTSEDG